MPRELLSSHTLGSSLVSDRHWNKNDRLSKAHLDMPVDVQRCNAGLGGLAASPLDNGFVQPFIDLRYHVFWIIKEEFLAAGEAQLKQSIF